jgi:hypothetical protein
MVGLIATLLAGLVVAPVVATTARVSGTLLLPADVAGPGPAAIAVITLIDASPADLPTPPTDAPADPPVPERP